MSASDIHAEAPMFTKVIIVDLITPLRAAQAVFLSAPWGTMIKGTTLLRLDPRYDF